MIDRLKKEVANIKRKRRRNLLVTERDFFIKVNGDIQSDLMTGILFIKETDLFFGISEGIIGNRKKIIVLTNDLDIASGGLLAVADTLLDKIGRIFRTFIVIKFHDATPL